MDTQQQNNLYPMILIGILFFIFGFVTWLNGILIPFLGMSCELTNFEAYLVTFAFYISYFVMALPSSYILKKTGLKNGIMYGLYIMAAGSLIFIPAALTRTFGLFLAGLFVQGTGLAIMQTASNPYVTILGPQESAARRISIMGICNKLAGAISPVILGMIVLGDSVQMMQNLHDLAGTERTLQLDILAQRVIVPYVIMAAVLIFLGAMVRIAHLPEIEPGEKDGSNDKNETKRSVFAYPNLVLGVIALFFYVGVEVLAGDSIVRYGLSLNLTPVMVAGINLATPTYFTTYTLIAMMIGYILGIIAIPSLISQSRALAVSAVLGLFFSAAVLFTNGFVSVLFIALLGLSNAVMWPAIWPLAISNLGRFTKTGSSLLIMAIAGGALLPLVYGRLADYAGQHNAYILLLPCYLIVLFYAVYGHRIKSFVKIH